MSGWLSRDTWIGVLVAFVVVTTMAIDHLIGTEGGPQPDTGDFPVDPAAFALSVGLSLTLTAVLFGVVIRRAARDEPEQAARKALGCALLAVPAISALFLAVPFPFAGAAIALGLRGRIGTSRRIATIAIVIGAFVLALGIGAYLALLLG